jgi:hypothetical protein
MLTSREAATILAALLYWREEMCPHGPAIMRPYFKHFQLNRIKPLTVDEIEQLCLRLRATIPKK